MYLERCQDQKSETLDEFYTRISQQDHPISREEGEAMLSLISRLRNLSDTRRVYGLTSHHRLCLLSKDTWQSPCFVIFYVYDRRNYTIEYLMPKDIAPWHDAYVRGLPYSEDEAVQMILTAMDRSGGWNEIR